MGNWAASAGAASRAENDLNLLFLGARKMVRSENAMPNQMAKERDLEFTRALTNFNQAGDSINDKVKSDIMIAKIVLAAFKLIIGGVEALRALDKASEAATDTADAAAEAALQQQKAIADSISLGLSVAGEVVTALSVSSDIAKNNKQRKTLAGEQASNSAATQAIDSTGKA